MVAGPVSPRKQRSACALASVGIASTASLEPGGDPAVRPAGAGEAARGGHLRDPLEHLGDGELAVAADAEDRAEHGRAPCARRGGRGRQHQRVA